VVSQDPAPNHIPLYLTCCMLSSVAVMLLKQCSCMKYQFICKKWVTKFHLLQVVLS